MELLLQKRIAKLEFERYIGRQKATLGLAKKLTGDNPKKSLIFLGSTENSPAIRGYVRTPNKKIVSKLKHVGATVILVDEFRSTMLCSKCFQPTTTSQSPHRWQYCKLCATTWNRDINAGRNIFYLLPTEASIFLSNKTLFIKLNNHPNNFNIIFHSQNSKAVHTPEQGEATHTS